MKICDSTDLMRALKAFFAAKDLAMSSPDDGELWSRYMMESERLREVYERVTNAQ